jgi:hypothetical protein
MTSNAVPPSVTPPSPNEWPNTIQSIQGISNDSIATITCANHEFVDEDVDVTTVMFAQVIRMLPINGLPGLITSIIDSSHFTVNINTTNFPPYGGGGIINTVTGHPPVEKQGFQYFNTPYQNIA